MTDILAIIGAGNMGAAFYAGLRGKTRLRINLCDHNREKLDALNPEHAFDDPREGINNASAVLLAVKPQSAKELLMELSPALSDRLIISIMNGITIASLEKLTRSPRIIRAMPNLPSQVKQGFTGWFASQAVTENDRTFARQIFDAVGEQMELEKEALINVIAALSGCGPAYFFYMAELLAARAIQEGFSQQEASVIARQTLIGSGTLLQETDKSPAEWRAAVSSKGGSTEAAIRSLQNAKLDEHFSAAIDAAIKRSQELSQ